MHFKSKHPASPKAGDILRIVSVRRIEVKNGAPAANEPKRGKLNYLGGPSKKKSPKPAASGKQVVEKRSLSIGRYIGQGDQLTAFVMLDPDEAPEANAANE